MKNVLFAVTLLASSFAVASPKLQCSLFSDGKLITQTAEGNKLYLTLALDRAACHFSVTADGYTKMTFSNGHLTKTQVSAEKTLTIDSDDAQCSCSTDTFDL